MTVDVTLSHRLLMGFMIVSSFLSMWISNTATTAMMLPIANAVLEQLKDTEMQAEEDYYNMAEDNPSFEQEATQTQQDRPEKADIQLEDRVCK